MKKILSQLPAPVLAGVVREQNAAAAIAEIRNCIYNGAGMIDLHLSCLEDSSTKTLEGIVQKCKLPILALNYNQTFTKANAGLSEEERVASLLRAVDAGAAGIDMQGYTFDAPSKSAFCGEDRYSFTAGKPKEVVTDPAVIEKQCALIEEVHAKGAEVLLSCHPGIHLNSTQLVDLALFYEERKPDMIKIVSIANTEEEMLESIKAMLLLKKEIKTPVTFHAGGKAGALTRIINPMLGGQIMFCVDHYKESSTMDQLHLATARRIVDDLSKIL